MKINDAFWEKRNLGVSCTEILIEKEDPIELLDEKSSIFDSAEYVVVKVPVARFDISEYLTKKGFMFMEGSINFHLNLKEATLTSLQQRLNGVVNYAEMNSDDLGQLYDEIKKGLFKSDRIILDSHFTGDQAAMRYINWIKDELAKTTQVFKILHKDQAIGFFTFKEIGEHIFYPFLAGMYEKYALSGLGFTTLSKPIEEAKKRNGKFISTYTSTNNPSVVRVHTQQGFTIKELQYVYIKHNIINT
jgi:hypothetical protein